MLAVRMAKTTTLSREEWLELRRHGIGGSDIATIAGLNPYRTLLSLYLEKVGELPEPPENEAVRWGRRLEAVVVEEFRERHPELRVQRVNAVLQDHTVPYFLANVDRVVRGHPEGPGILEVKTTGAAHSDEWEDGVRAPFSAQVQLQWYLGITGYTHGWIVALVGGQRYVEVPVRRDDEVIARLREMARQFWENHVVPRVPPEWTAADVDLVTALYPEAKAGERTVLPLEAQELIQQYLEAEAEEKAARARKEEAKVKLQALLGEAEVGLLAGEPVVSWPTYRRQVLDTKRLAQELPDVYHRYLVETTYRTFRILRKGAK